MIRSSSSSGLMAGLVTLTGVVAWSGEAQAGWSDGVLSVTNARHEPVRVLIDQRSHGEILPGEAEVYRLPPGSHEVQLLDLRGASLRRETVLIHAFRAEALLLDPADGELDITNRTGASLRLLVDGQAAGALAPGASVSLPIAPGRHTVGAVFEQSGQTRSLAEQVLRVEPGEEERVTLQPPATGLVRVINTQGTAGTVQVNGAWAASLGARQEVVFEAPIGESWITVVAAGGRTLEQERLVISPFADNTVTVEPEPFGTLTIHNPLPIPVLLKSGPQSRVLQPQERVSWERVRAGQRTVEVSRLSGEVIGSMSVTIPHGKTAAVSVPVPREGVIAFTNAGRHEAWVYVDNRLVERVLPGAQARLPTLPGRHEVRVLVGGRVVYSQHHTVELYADTVVGAGHSSHSLSSASPPPSHRGR